MNLVRMFRGWSWVALVAVGLLSAGMAATPAAGSSATCQEKRDAMPRDVLAASRNETPLWVGDESRGAEFIPRLTSAFPPRFVNDSLGKPFNLTSEVHVIRAVSDDGTDFLIGYIQCDFYRFQLEVDGEKSVIGHTPDPRPHGEVPRGKGHNNGDTAAEHSDRHGPTGTPAPGGSIQTTKHTHTSGTVWDPLNVIWYDLEAGEVKHILDELDFTETPDCGGDQQVYFNDWQHGGSNQWQWQDTQFTGWDNPAAPCDTEERLHVREYWSQAPDGDYHGAGSSDFGHYSWVPIHVDNTWHTQAYAQWGQDELYYMLSGHHHVSDLYFRSIVNDPSDCGICDTWGYDPDHNPGYIDLYEMDWENPPVGINCNGVDVTDVPNTGYGDVHLDCL